MVSGGQLLDSPVSREGGAVRWGGAGECGPVWAGRQRLLPARSPNTEWGWNRNTARPPWHSVTGLLQETQHCTRWDTNPGRM